MKTVLILSAIVAAVAAVPVDPKQCPSVQQNANFDDLLQIPGSVLNPIPVPYKGLFFQGATYATVISTGLLPAIPPHSGKNYAAVGVASETLGGTAMLTTNYPSSNTTSFQLQSFYFGCVLQALNGATAAPAACNINISGYKGSDNTVSASQQVCSQSYSYNPTTSLGVQQQAFGQFDDCAGKDIQFAVIQFSFVGGMSAANPLAGLVLDDIKYLIKTKSC